MEEKKRGLKFANNSFLTLNLLFFLRNLNKLNMIIYEMSFVSNPKSWSVSGIHLKFIRTASNESAEKQIHSNVVRW